jgi:hypothetical protein
MKVIITESQFYLLTESVEGLDEFKTLTLAKYPEVIEYWDVIENFIRKSECKRIEVGNLKIGIDAFSFYNFSRNCSSIPI